MSSTIEVYVVDLNRLKSAAGSADTSLAKAIMKQQADFLSSIDDIDEESELKAADALRELIDGEVSGDGGGYLYGYALKAICAHIGTTLENISAISGANEWIELIDQALASRGVLLQLSGLLYGGSPVEIPEPDDYPFIGCWNSQEMAQALPAIRALDLAGVDREIAETIQQIGRWLEEAARKPGMALVGFLS